MLDQIWQNIEEAVKPFTTQPDGVLLFLLPLLIGIGLIVLALTDNWRKRRIPSGIMIATGVLLIVLSVTFVKAFFEIRGIA